MDLRPLYLITTGLLGVGCCLVLLFLTVVGEAILIWRGRQNSAADEHTEPSDLGPR
jgi:hypothetical protein